MKEDRKPFVVVEGGSGCGKSTAIRGMMESKLANWRLLREPGGTEFGELMREAVQQRMDIEIDPLAALLAYSASRANLVQTEILPTITGRRCTEVNGVLLDRYWFSSVAYQGSERVDKAMIIEISKIATDGLMPDLILHFDLIPELALLRKQNCVDIDRYDMKALEYHARVRDSYLELAVEYPTIWKIIDASKSKEEVLADALRVMEEAGLIT